MNTFTTYAESNLGKSLAEASNKELYISLLNHFTFKHTCFGKDVFHHGKKKSELTSSTAFDPLFGVVSLIL